MYEGQPQVTLGGLAGTQPVTVCLMDSQQCTVYCKKVGWKVMAIGQQMLGAYQPKLIALLDFRLLSRKFWVSPSFSQTCSNLPHWTSQQRSVLWNRYLTHCSTGVRPFFEIVWKGVQGMAVKCDLSLERTERRQLKMNRYSNCVITCILHQLGSIGLMKMINFDMLCIQYSIQ